MQLLTGKKTKAESHEICVQRCRHSQVCWGCKIGGLLLPGLPWDHPYLYTDLQQKGKSESGYKSNPFIA